MGNAGGDPNRAMAERNTIIRVPVGSTVHGLNLDDTADRDEMGVCIEPISGLVGFKEFDQYIYRTASERTGKQDAPSEPGDLDLTIYSLRKFLRLAMHGNPTVLTLLFVPPELRVSSDARGARLQELAPAIVSRQSGKRFLGYMEAQRQRLLGERGQLRTNRPHLIEQHGFDTKYASHILRLGFQGVELLTTGRLTLPLPEPTRSMILDVKRGKWSFNDVLQAAGDLERQLKDLLTDSMLPAEPDTETVEAWMIRMYFENWKADQAYINEVVR